MPITDADIDPRLLAESNDDSIDPAMALFRQAQTVAATSLSTSISASISTSGNGNDTIGDNDDDDELPRTVDGPAMVMQQAANLPPLSVNVRLANLARIIKSSKSFKPKSEADIDKYCTALDLEERNFLSYILGIEIRDRLDELASPSNWVMSESLKKNITLFTKVFVLSATTKSYKGNGPGHILKAMQELGTHDLPAEKDVLQVAEVLSFISDRLTSARNIVKVKIKESMEEDSNIANIANLTQSLIAKTPIKHTLQLYIRLAFLRWHMLKYGDDTEYWDKVDATLSKWVTEAKSEQDLTVSFNITYQEDIKKYGDPSGTNYKVAQPTEVDEWFKTFDRHASAAQGAAKKRKRQSGGVLTLILRGFSATPTTLDSGFAAFAVYIPRGAGKEVEAKEEEQDEFGIKAVVVIEFMFMFVAPFHIRNFGDLGFYLLILPYLSFIVVTWPVLFLFILGILFSLWLIKTEKVEKSQPGDSAATRVIQTLRRLRYNLTRSIRKYFGNKNGPLGAITDSNRGFLNYSFINAWFFFVPASFCLLVILVILLSALLTLFFIASFIFTAVFEIVTTNKVPQGATHVPTFYSPRTKSDRYSRMIVFAIFGVIFGGIHCIGWDFFFPTHYEHAIWRYTSVVLTAIPLVAAPIDYILENHKMDKGFAKIVRIVLHIFMTALLFAYVPARLSLIAQALALLRDQPPAAFLSVDWTKYIPHLFN